jgi:hypothetical protein
MKIIKFIIGTIVSIIALAIATKIAAIILGVLSFGFILLLFLLKLAIIVAVVAGALWLLSRIFSSKRRSESM